MVDLKTTILTTRNHLRKKRLVYLAVLRNGLVRCTVEMILVILSVGGSLRARGRECRVHTGSLPELPDSVAQRLKPTRRPLHLVEYMPQAANCSCCFHSAPLRGQRSRYHYRIVAHFRQSGSSCSPLVSQRTDGSGMGRSTRQARVVLYCTVRGLDTVLHLTEGGAPPQFLDRSPLRCLILRSAPSCPLQIVRLLPSVSHSSGKNAWSGTDLE